MRKIIVLEHLSLDGVFQSPGGENEDASGGFRHGGWIAPYADEIQGTALRKQMNASFDLLLGRKTFEIWEPYWSQHPEIWPAVNTATKYVASTSRSSSHWQPSVFLNGDIAAQVSAIKRQPGADLHVWGSGNLLQSLLRHDLVDVFWLMIYPITLGSGKRLFETGTLPATFKLTESIVTGKGVVIVEYTRAGTLAPDS
ncbi:MAG TPA: dihydrofolate reductase family protein [Anaerolineales bacterium]|nr:dihydrofolate reductase family protein [Anaerolineales bacterium]